MLEFFPDRLLEYIAAGESTKIEFKSRLPSFEVLARVLSSFANTDGGILIIGVQDDGTVTGITDEQFLIAEKRLEEVGHALFPIELRGVDVPFSSFPYPMKIGKFKFEDKNLVYAEVRKIPDYVYPIMTPRGEYYQRVDKETITNPASLLREELQEKVDTIKPLGRSIIAFVAMSFREEEEPALVDYYRAMEHAVVATKLPIELRRMDLLDGDFEISQQIMDRIASSDIVIADFTLSSRNVYFELGYARGMKRRVIQTARKGTLLEFDIRNWKTIIYRNATELEEKLIGELLAAYSEIATTKKG